MALHYFSIWVAGTPSPKIAYGEVRLFKYVRQTKGLMHDDCASNSGSVGAHRRLGVRRCRTQLAGATTESGR